MEKTNIPTEMNSSVIIEHGKIGFARIPVPKI
jgi:hypothetical protein